MTNDEAVVLWEADFSFEGKSPVSHLKVAQLQEGVSNIVVAREDGLIEVFTFN